jgi:predicted dehydrogenase
VSGGKLRVGIVGANIERGFAIAAHIPALQVLPGFEITAVCTTREASANQAAAYLGIPLAFTDPARLAEHPDVDVVAVSVRVPSHREVVLTALAAGKHVYCEWPLGRNLEEGRELLAAAESAGVRHLVGLQARGAPWANYVRDLVAQGYVGRVVSATMAVSSASRPPSADSAFMLDRASGMNPLAIAGGHTLDLLRYCLGELRVLSAFEVNQYPLVTTAAGETLAKSTLDQLVLSGIIGDDLAVSYQLRGGGIPRLPRFSFEIHGEETDLVLTSQPAVTESMQRQHLNVSRRSPTGELVGLEVPDGYRSVPPETPPGAPFNVAQLYVRLARAIEEGVPAEPGFDVGVSAHELLAAVTRSSEEGVVQAPPLSNPGALAGGPTA